MSASLSVTFMPDYKAIRSLAGAGGMVGNYIMMQGARVQKLAKAFAPVDTGALEESIWLRAGEEDGMVVAEVGSDLDYAIYQELGTSFHGAQPYLRPALTAVFGAYMGDE